MEKNNVKQIHDFGQSVWLDFIDRKIMNSGELKRLINEDGVRGITSNPAIFEKAISSSDDYKDDIAELTEKEISNEAIFYGVAIEDIKRAADMFLPLYEDAAGRDGFVSLEVSPHFARNTEATAQQAFELWKTVRKENVMIKIPGTAEGLTAIRRCIREGININVTLIFGLERYEEVADAYISGLEDRLKNNQPLDFVASVASFFLSRIDLMIDPVLEQKGLSHLKGKVAIASAKKAYEIYQRIFTSDRFKKLQEKGAQPQRLLWASTGSKDPASSDVKYVEALIGTDTVNTIPMDTLIAFKDHGVAASRLEDDLDQATKVMEDIKNAGIDIDLITKKLEDEGIEKFNVPYDKLLLAIEGQKKKIKD